MAKLVPSNAFKRQFGKLDPQIQREVSKSLDDLAADKLEGLRMHCLQGFDNPKIYKIDAARGKKFQVSFSRDGDVISLRSVGTHQRIDGTG